MHFAGWKQIRNLRRIRRSTLSRSNKRFEENLNRRKQRKQRGILVGFRKRGGSPRRPPKAPNPPASPLCDLRDLCAMLSRSALFPPISHVSTQSSQSPIPLCDLRDLCAMLSRSRCSRPSAKMSKTSHPQSPSVTSVTSVRCFPIRVVPAHQPRCPPKSENWVAKGRRRNDIFAQWLR